MQIFSDSDCYCRSLKDTLILSVFNFAIFFIFRRKTESWKKALCVCFLNQSEIIQIISQWQLMSVLSWSSPSLCSSTCLSGAAGGRPPAADPCSRPSCLAAGTDFSWSSHCRGETGKIQHFMLLRSVGSVQEMSGGRKSGHKLRGFHPNFLNAVWARAKILEISSK